jgi:hypothetical protein
MIYQFYRFAYTKSIVAEALDDVYQPKLRLRYLSRFVRVSDARVNTESALAPQVSINVSYEP